MKQIFTCIALILLFASCNKQSKPIVSATFIDSLFSRYSDTVSIQSIETEIRFWKDRINPSEPGLVNELRYGAALVQRFRLSGDIYDLKTADSVLYIADKAFKYKETGPKLALVHNYILQHRFTEADSVFQQAKNTGMRVYESAINGFDVAFELGQYMLAQNELNKMSDRNDFGYQFRKAKLAHYNGDIDTAINAMARAAEIANDNIALKQAALSNEADLNLHNSNLEQAAKLYRISIALGANDLHSIAGLGWIALVHDKNDTLAEKIFRFVQTRTKAPDALYKLMQVGEARGDSMMQKKQAIEFAGIATKPVYGGMYNKYLIEIYTGIINDPAKAVAIAQDEITNRNTPQTNAWLVWALHKNNETTKAAEIYKDRVSGKPLEGLELFWMGQYMLAQDKGFNAKEYFKAAYKNRYDLGPAMQQQLEELQQH